MTYCLSRLKPIEHSQTYRRNGIFKIIIIFKNKIINIFKNKIINIFKNKIINIFKNKIVNIFKNKSSFLWNLSHMDRCLMPDDILGKSKQIHD